MVVKKREGEQTAALIYRFTKKIQQSGVLRESKKRRFSHRRVTRNKRHKSAMYKADKTEAILKERKSGLL